MKKLFALFLAVFLILSVSAACARSFDSLRDLQDYLSTHAPDQLIVASDSFTAEGSILDIRWCGDGNHYEMTLAVSEDRALTPIGCDSPRITVHFRLHMDPMPFDVGDLISVSGSVNPLYSSVMIPWILADTINGSADF